MVVSLPDTDALTFLKKAKRDFEKSPDGCHFVHIPKNIAMFLTSDEDFSKMLIGAAILGWSELVTEIRKAYRDDAALKEVLEYAKQNAAGQLGQILQRLSN